MKRCVICDSNTMGLSLYNADHPYTTRLRRDSHGDYICGYCSREISNDLDEDYIHDTDDSIGFIFEDDIED